MSVAPEIGTSPRKFFIDILLNIIRKKIKVNGHIKGQLFYLTSYGNICTNQSYRAFLLALKWYQNELCRYNSL